MAKNCELQKAENGKLLILSVIVVLLDLIMKSSLILQEKNHLG